MIELLSLTSQLKSGRDTFNQLYKEYYRKAYLYAKSYVGDTFVAEDIASEAMITVWEKMKTSEKKELISFLFVILKILGKNQLTIFILKKWEMWD